MRVATWNVENLFRPGSESGPDTDEAYQAKLTSLAGTITTMNPQVLAVQEVGDPAALDDLVTHLDGQWHTELARPRLKRHPRRLPVPPAAQRRRAGR